jgi:murein DD-endopeptidase MepM/ murein hydrolase activator NlpD
MFRNLFCVLLLILSFSCSRKLIQPSFINFNLEKDSIYVISKNNFYCPVFNKITNVKTNEINFVQLEPNTSKVILKYHQSQNDSISILKSYDFRQFYGRHHIESYDSTFNYALPFLKNKKYKIIQAYNGGFTHNNTLSRYTLDFKMNISDTVVSARDGIVIKVIENHNKQGVTKDFRPYANYIIVYHQDNTIAQYVHLKQNGSLVKVGDSVKVNQPIALSGFTGWTTTPHLHFGVFKIVDDTQLVSIPIILDSIDANTLKKGMIIFKN